jgi:hypothetical protein
MNGQRKWLPLALVAAAVVVVAGLAITMFGGSSGPKGAVETQVVNDSGETARFAVCEDNRCSQLAGGAQTVPPGGSFRLKVIRYGLVPIMVSPVQNGRAGSGQCRLLVVGEKIRDHYLLAGLDTCGD